MEEFGKRLKELREEHQLTQTVLANNFSVTQRTVHAWETDKQEPDLRTIVGLARFFEVSIGYLLGVEDA